MGTENIKLGTCTVTLGGTDCGVTLGGVEFMCETTTHESKVDQFGETVVAERITGRNISVTVPMAEATLDNMVLVIPGATLITDGTDANKKQVVVTTGVGTDLLASALSLVLHPIDLAPADVSEDLTIPLAATPGGISFAYKIDQERVYNADFKGYPDATGILFRYGDTTAVAA